MIRAISLIFLVFALSLPDTNRVEARDGFADEVVRAVRADAPAPSPRQPWPHTQEVRQVILETLASKGFQRAGVV